jgi:hypothetical protein
VKRRQRARGPGIESRKIRIVRADAFDSAEGNIDEGKTQGMARDLALADLTGIRDPGTCARDAQEPGRSRHLDTEPTTEGEPNEPKVGMLRSRNAAV